MRVRIFQQPRDVSQSGAAGSTIWLLEWPQGAQRRNDPLMGWWGSSDTQTQVHLHFATSDEAVAYAQANKLDYDLELPPIRVHTPKVYADNFKYGRLENWTH